MRIRYLIIGCICIFSVSIVRATTLIVTNTDDGGAGSLRDTIAAANSGDTIQFASALNGQVISLIDLELLIDKDLTILGPGSGLLTVKRSADKITPAFRIFEIVPGHTVTIQGLTISNGEAEFSNEGGGIYNNGSDVTIIDCAITANRAGIGGGISVRDANGTTSASLTLNSSTVSGNSATAINGGGGGIGIFKYQSGSITVTIDGSTLSSNATEDGGAGGGISNASFDGGYAILTIRNSTISGNLASSTGGAIDNYGSGGAATVTISNSTFSNNTSFATDGSCIYNTRGTISLIDTILKGSGGNIFNKSGVITSQGYNVSNDNGGGFLIATEDQINVDPRLGPLQNNGGPTLTHELLTGSPAINRGNPSFTPPPNYDQRGSGFPRVISGRVDIGAFEVQMLLPTPTPGPTATPGTTVTPTPAPTFFPTATPGSTPITPGGNLINISTRLKVLNGDKSLIAGFIVSGNVSKRVLIRAIGPSLANVGVPDPLADPTLQLHGPEGFNTVINYNWRDSQLSEIEATGLAPVNGFESAILSLLPPGPYTAIEQGNGGATGIGLIEVYDLDTTADARLSNISTRGFVDSGDSAMIGGFILANGSVNAHVLLRAIGPSLEAFGVPDALADPTLELHNNDGETVAANDNWKDTQQAEISATGIAPTDDHESAILGILPPGSYTAIVRGKNGATGVALVEAYQFAVAARNPASRSATK